MSPNTLPSVSRAMIRYGSDPYWHSVSCVCEQCLYADTMLKDVFFSSKFRHGMLDEDSNRELFAQPPTD